MNYNQVVNPINEQFRERQEIDSLRENFKNKGIVILKDFLNKELHLSIKYKIQDMYHKMNRKDFNMEEYRTPRNMLVKGGKYIMKEIPELAMLYMHHEVINFVQNIVRDKIYPCTHEDEYAVLNCLDGAGDTHGWHLDDPDIALIMCFESPEAGLGGEIEVSKHKYDISEIKSFINSENYENIADVYPIAAGDAYILLASKYVHRVRKIEIPNGKRWASNFAYQLTERLEYGSTASILYSEET